MLTLSVFGFKYCIVNKNYEIIFLKQLKNPRCIKTAYFNKLMFLLRNFTTNLSLKLQYNFTNYKFHVAYSLA